MQLLNRGCAATGSTDSTTNNNVRAWLRVEDQHYHDTIVKTVDDKLVAAARLTKLHAMDDTPL